MPASVLDLCGEEGQTDSCEQRGESYWKGVCSTRCKPGNPSVRKGTVPWAEQGWDGFREHFGEPFSG